jgi:hypothetical protein
VRGLLLGAKQELRANTTICFTGTACFITITFSISTDWSWATYGLTTTVLVVTVNKPITVVIGAVAAIFLYSWWWSTVFWAIT